MGHSAEEKIKILYEDSLKDIHELTGRMETMTEMVVIAAKTVANGKTVLHKQNEAFLMDRIKEITTAVAELRGMESAMQLAVKNQADVVIKPLVDSLSEQVKQLTKKDTFAMRFMQKTEATQEKTDATQEKMASSIKIITISFVILIVLAYIAGRFTK
jgi:hypothetical protein